MRNLKPVSRLIAFWDIIVNAKRPLATRNNLRNNRAVVKSSYKLYSQLARSQGLQTLPGSLYTDPLASQLRGCYSDTYGFNYLKSKIREKQEPFLLAECQYCNIGSPDTLDHFIPKEDFPEYAVLSINLIPCCPTCNNKKGEEWLEHGHPRFLNFYYDELPNVQYLECTITYERHLPIANYTLNLTRLGAPMRSIVATHFHYLDLLNRFKERSNGEIVNVRNALQPAVGRATLAIIRNELKQEAANIRLSKGVNHWQAALKEAISNSTPFLNELGFH